ncbi:MAG: hypothetical protein R3Y13_04130 [bacterium]
MNVIIANKYQTLLGSSEIDVIKTSFGVFEASEIINLYKNFFYNKLIIDVTALQGYENIDVIQALSLNLDMSKVILLLDDSEKVNSPEYLSKLVTFGIYNFTRKVDTVKFLIDQPNAYKDVAGYQNLENKNVKILKFNDDVNRDSSRGEISRRVLGIQNVTEHAGATTLGYLLKKHLERDYKVVYYEVNKNDFGFFLDKKMQSTNSQGIQGKLADSMDEEVVLIDLNGDATTYCDEVIYLIEPGIIKLNKLIKHQPKVFSNLKDEKIILNMCALTKGDIKDFEKECGRDIFSNVPYLDDKIEKDDNIASLLISLGFTRIDR